MSVARARPDARLVGWDTDEGAVRAARETCALAGIRAEIALADALADPPRLPSVDLVLGNPPWVRPQNLPCGLRADVWARFSCATDKADLYAAFVERSLDLAPRAALVLPDTWLHLASFAALRRRIEAAGIEAILELPRGTFRNMPLPTVLLDCRPGGRRLAGRIERDPEARAIFGGSVRAAPHAWSLGEPLPELSGRPLGEYVHLHMGVVCGDYARYVHPRRLYPEDRPTCRGRDVHRYTIGPTVEHLRWLPRDMLSRKPYVAPKHEGLFDVPEKIVVAGTTGTEIRAAMDLERRFPLDSCYVLLPRSERVDLWGVLGFLLSGPVRAWYGARHRAPRVKAVELARIPLPDPPWEGVASAARARDDAALETAVRMAYGP